MGWSQWWLDKAAELIADGFTLQGSYNYPEVVRGKEKIKFARGLVSAWHHWQYECWLETGERHQKAVREYVIRRVFNK